MKALFEEQRNRTREDFDGITSEIEEPLKTAVQIAEDLKTYREQIMADLAQPYVQGLTLLGGEPFLNTGILLPLINAFGKSYQKKISGLGRATTWEEMMLETPDKLELLSMIDILVDGRYDKSKRNLMLQFRGSSNQRIIDVQKSMQSGKVVIWDKLNDGKESYEQVKRE